MIYDVSLGLYPGMPVYPGDPEFERVPQQSGDAYISRLALGTHTGTHIDAPAHYFSGAAGIDSIPLTSLISQVEVSRYPSFTGLVPAVFFKNSEPFSDELVTLLLQRGIKTVGCDRDSVGSSAIHRRLLEKNIVIVECLSLSSVPAGIYSMAALPLKIMDADAAPARVILFDTQENIV